MLQAESAALEEEESADSSDAGSSAHHAGNRVAAQQFRDRRHVADRARVV